ncbi:hypothetical protein ABTZ03_03250 [Kitasatospora sp. NPDC096077]|uniref:hypothetical protein n=1 Tax=Kitasatospora sp. NPDC096077 TaxID=3155544 RepID=UPI00331F6B9F
MPYDDDGQGDDTPPLEPVAESLTLRRLRHEVRKVNDRPRFLPTHNRCERTPKADDDRRTPDRPETAS